MNKGSHVKIGFSIEIELIMNQLIGGICIDAIPWEAELRYVYFATVARRVRRCNIVFDVVGLVRETCLTGLTGEAQKFIRINVLPITNLNCHRNTL